MDLLVSALAAAVMASMSGASNLASNSNSQIPQEPAAESAPKVVTEKKQERLNDIFIVPVSSDCDYWYAREFNSIHKGLDIADSNVKGCKILAAADGKVIFADWSDDGSGYKVVIKHSKGYKTEYHHGSGEFYVKSGDSVKQGNEIMMMGCTGFCTGTHLHFEVSLNGKEVDPRTLK